jgi:hypothetical protein
MRSHWQSRCGVETGTNPTQPFLISVRSVVVLSVALSCIAVSRDLHDFVHSKKEHSLTRR